MRRQEAAVALPETLPTMRTSPPSPQSDEATRLPPIASSPAPVPEPPQQRCRRVLTQVFDGVLLPEDELRFFNASCVRR